MARPRYVRRLAVHSALVALAMVSAAPPMLAQESLQMRVQPEIRVDAIIADRASSIQAGAGAQIPMGYYVRLGVVGAVGPALGAHANGVSGRVDVVGRFLLDPFRQSRFGVSVGGGLSVLAAPGERARPLLLTVLDIEGQRSSSGIVPALQLGLGGGVRIGAVLRWGSQRMR